MADLTASDVIPPPERIHRPDQAELLSIVFLTLLPAHRAITYDAEHMVVKNEPGRAYLALTPAQWRVLKSFANRTVTVPQVLFELISDRRCIPLREFYEIIVKAYEYGLLVASGEAARSEQPSVEWPQRCSGRRVRPLVMVAAVGAVVSMAWHTFTLPVEAWELAVGWLLACVTTSIGYYLAACVVRDEEAEVYSPSWHWRTLFPHYHVDLDDAIMGGRESEVNAALARLAPLLVAMGIVPFIHPGISFLLFCSFIFHLSPFWWSPSLRLAHARYGHPSLDAFHSFKFEPNRNTWHALRQRIKHADIKFLNLHLGMTIGWLTLVLLAGSLPLRADAIALWQTYQASGGLHFTALAMLTLLGLMVVGSLGVSLWLVFGTLVLKFHSISKKIIPPRTVPVSSEELVETLNRSLLFRGFSREERANIAAVAAPQSFRKNRIIVKEGDPGSTVFVVHSGRVEVLRDTPSGRPERVAILDRGDVFGERALLEAGVRTRSVRTLGDAVLISLERQTFEDLVLSKLGRSQVTEIIQKVAFLHRIDLSATWTPQAMIAFARRAIIQSFEVGQTLIRAHDDNQYFFLLYEGELSVQRSNKEVARLKTGDFFGEISALQNSAATATIIVRTPAKCMVVAKREFLQFLVNDFLVGLHFEKISSDRLGAPIFPLKGKSFDVIRG